MDNILSDEELAALLKLYPSDMEVDGLKAPADEMVSLDEQELSRHFFRLQQSFDATIKLRVRRRHVKVTNLSLGGAFVLGDIDLPIDKRVKLSIRLPNPAATIVVRSYVCWRKRVDHRVVGLGMRFTMLKTEDIWLIISNMKQALLESGNA